MGAGTRRNFISVLVFITCAMLLLVGSTVEAQSTFVPLVDVKGSARLTDLYNSQQDLGAFLNKLFISTIAIGAILAVLRLAWAGFQYMGSDAWGSKEHAKEIIRDTLLGLFLLLSIWLILYQINPDILRLQIKPAEVKNIPAPAPDLAKTAKDLREKGGWNARSYETKYIPDIQAKVKAEQKGCDDWGGKVYNGPLTRTCNQIIFNQYTDCYELPTAGQTCVKGKR